MFLKDSKVSIRMRRFAILVASIALLGTVNAPSAGDTTPTMQPAGTFDRTIEVLISSIRESGSISAARLLIPDAHPWGGAVWLHEGYVTIDKAEFGTVRARRPAFTLGFQRLPRSECERILSVRQGRNIAGDGVLQVSAKNVETGDFVSFKGAGLDTTPDQVDLACDGSLFTVTVSFAFAYEGMGD